MSPTKVFTFFLIILQTEKSALSRHISSKPIHFEFSHYENLAVSDIDDDLEDEYDDPFSDSSSEQLNSGHVRKRRSVKWVPNYDLYEQWAEEYYAQNEEQEQNIENTVKAKESLLDKLISASQNKTKEEIELERKDEEQRREILKNTIVYGTWTLGIIALLCFAVFLIKKFWRMFTCDFCDVLSYKKKIKNLLQNTVPGVYVHMDGTKEHYKPTAEELDALKDINKILFSLA